MKVRGVHHVQITIPVGSEDEARRFYCDVLGLSEVAKPEALLGRGGFWLRAGKIDVHVGVEDGVDRAATKAHVAFEVEGLAAWRKKLAGVGIAPKDSVPIPGCDRFEFRDPFGNRLELMEQTGE